VELTAGNEIYKINTESPEIFCIKEFKNKMQTIRFSSRIKILAALLLALIFFVQSCKKTSPRSSPDKAQSGKDNTQTTTEVPPPRGLVPVPIELPNPMFVGTPQDFKVSNLEKPLGKPRPPFLAPPGTENAAFLKTVSGTDDMPIIGEIEMITDGDKQATDGSYVELGPFLQSVTIDLQAKYDIYAVLLWHYHQQARVYYDVIVQLADDPDFTTNIRTLFNNDRDNSSGLGIGSDMHYVETHEGKLIDAKGARARYVRLYSNGNSSNELNHYIEVEVFGKPAK